MPHDLLPPLVDDHASVTEGGMYILSIECFEAVLGLHVDRACGPGSLVESRSALPVIAALEHRPDSPALMRFLRPNGTRPGRGFGRATALSRPTCATPRTSAHSTGSTANCASPLDARPTSRRSALR